MLLARKGLAIPLDRASASLLGEEVCVVRRNEEQTERGDDPGLSICGAAGIFEATNRAGMKGTLSSGAPELLPEEEAVSVSDEAERSPPSKEPCRSRALSEQQSGLDCGGRAAGQRSKSREILE